MNAYLWEEYKQTRKYYSDTLAQWHYLHGENTNVFSLDKYGGYRYKPSNSLTVIWLPTWITYSEVKRRSCEHLNTEDSPPKSPRTSTVVLREFSSQHVLENFYPVVSVSPTKLKTRASLLVLLIPKINSVEVHAYFYWFLCFI